MKKVTLLLLTVVMLVCSAMGIASFAFADGTTKVQVNAYDMSTGETFGSQFAWQANAEDQFCVFTDSLNLNTGASNDVIVEFTSPISGTATIANNWTFCSNTSGKGDGARVRLIHNDVQIYPTNASWVDIPTDKSNVFLNAGTFAVAQGDKIYMVFNNGGNSNNTDDSIYYCLGMQIDGNWFGSNEYWYTNAEEGAVEVTYAGVTCKKSDLIKYKYGSVTEIVEEEPTPDPDPKPTTAITAKVTAYDMSAGSTFPWQATAEDQYCILTGATDLNAGETNNIIIEFTAPFAGVASFADNGTFAKLVQEGSDGARVRLIHNETQIYPKNSKWLDLPVNGDNVVLLPDMFEVAQGDKIYMVFDNGGNFSNGYDGVYYCLGFKLAGHWFGSNTYWYANAEEGNVEADFAGTNYKKSDLIKYKYGFVSDSIQGEVMDESSATVTDMEVLVGTTFDGVDRFKGNEQQFCQFEKIGMNIMPGIPNIVAMEMTANGMFNIQNSYFLTFNNPANIEVIKNDKVLYTATVGGSYSSIDAMPAISVNAGDVIYVRFTAGETGAYLRYALNGVLTTANGVVSYSTLDTVANGAGNVTFYTSKEAAVMGDVTTAELKTIEGVDMEQMFYNNGQWGGREQFCLIWKDGGNVYVHTGATYNPSISYEFSNAGIAKISKLEIVVCSMNSDGVRFRILKKTAGETPVYQQLYPLTAEWETVTYGQEGVVIDTEIVSVAQGDELILVVNQNGTNSLDQSDVKFDIAFQAEGQKVQTFNFVSEYTTEKTGAWKYFDATIPADYSNTKVGEVVENNYVSLEKNRMNFNEMTYFSTLNRWGIAGVAWAQVESGSIHPNAIYATAIGIKMPADGRVDMSETKFRYDLHSEPDEDGRTSDGVRFRIIRNQDIIYPVNGGWQEINDANEHVYDIPVFDVAKDDMIYLIVDCGAAGKEAYDLTYVTIIAHFAEDGADWTNTFDSKAAFVKTDKNYDAFSYYTYYYDLTSSGDNENSGDNNGSSDDTPVVDVTPGGCGSSMGANAFVAIITVAFAGFFFARKRNSKLN